MRQSEHKKDAKVVPWVYTMSERKSFETCFNKSAVKDHITKANHVDWEWAKEVDRKNNHRLRQVKEAIRISQSTHVMDLDQGTYNLSNLYGLLFTTPYKCNSK